MKQDQGIPFDITGDSGETSRPSRRPYSWHRTDAALATILYLVAIAFVIWMPAMLFSLWRFAI